MTTTASAVPLESVPIVKAVRSDQWRVLRRFSCSEDWQEVAHGSESAARRAFGEHEASLGRGALMLVRPDGSVAASTDAEVPA